MEEKQDHHKKPQWYIDEMKDIRVHIDSKADAITVKHISDVQDAMLKYGIAAICAGAVSIGGLYMLYYSGLADLKTQVQVMDAKLTGVKEDVTNIKRIISEAEVTK